MTLDPGRPLLRSYSQMPKTRASSSRAARSSGVSEHAPQHWIVLRPRAKERPRARFTSMVERCAWKLERRLPPLLLGKRRPSSADRASSNLCRLGCGGFSASLGDSREPTPPAEASES